jgi:hypothetical protein
VGLVRKDVKEPTSWKMLIPLLLAVAGICVSLTWKAALRKVKIVIALYVAALREMELDLPGSFKMFHIEDKLYPRDSDGHMVPGKGLNFSDWESRRPGVFAVFHALVGIGLLSCWLLANLLKWVC